VIAHFLAAILSGFIAGTALTAVVMWFRRDKIRARLLRKRR
jgi:hypothetical protein